MSLHKQTEHPNFIWDKNWFGIYNWIGSLGNYQFLKLDWFPPQIDIPQYGR